MSSILNAPEPMNGEQLQQANKVKTLGTVALVLAILGLFIPIAGLFMLIAAFLISTYAMKVSQNNGIDLEYESRASKAKIISVAFFALWVLGIVFTFMSSF